MTPSPRFRHAVLAAVAAACDQFDRRRCPRRRRFPRTSRAPLRPAATWPPGMPASSATRRRPRPTTARRCAAIRATAKFSIAPSSPCWPTARSTKRSSSPSASCRSTRTIASRGSCSVCARSSRSNIAAARRELAQSVRGPITDLAATLLAAWTQATPGEAQGRRSIRSTSCRARTGTRSSRTCMPA